MNPIYPFSATPINAESSLLGVEDVSQQPNAIPKRIFEQHALQQFLNHENREERAQALVMAGPSTPAASDEVVLQNLENSFGAFAFGDVDVHADCGFADYLCPNEGGAINICTHLDKIEEPGILVSVGTERSFFDLCLCRPEKCQGLVVRDINPRVKAYVDFNTLLLRISANRKQYCALSRGPMEKLEGRMRNTWKLIRTTRIREILEQSNIENPAKQYYLTHLDAFARIYFETSQEWNEDIYYQGVHYHKDDQLFYRLQKYAKEGQIIATIGSINDLQFLQNMNVAFVDVSNVPQYSLIDLQLNEQSNPLIMWTLQNSLQTRYNSNRQEFLTGRRKEEMNQLLDTLKEAGVISRVNDRLGVEVSNLIKESNTHLAASFSEKTLSSLEKYRDRHMIHTPETGWICFEPFNIRKLNTMNQAQLQVLSHHPRIGYFIDKLVGSWVILDRQTYLAFSSVPGWKEAFQKYAKASEDNEVFMRFAASAPQLQALVNLCG